MPDPNWYPQQADLERKVGGGSNLAQIANAVYGSAGFIAFVDSCLAVGRGAVRQSVEVKHEPETIDTLDTETTISIRRAATVKAAEAAWNDGTGDLALPDKLAAEIAAMNSYLEEIATGHKRLGRAAGFPGAALGQPVGVVNYDPQGCQISINGFKRGFR